MASVTQKCGVIGSDFLADVFLSSKRIFYVDVDPYNMVFQGDMLSSNRRPSGGGNSEVRCHRALIVCGACFSSPYASFEWMWTPIT